MKVISLNVNGIRAARKRGLEEWIKQEKPDILCFQEVKQGSSANPPIFESNEINSYFINTNPAVKNGYSGTAVFSKDKPLEIVNNIGLERFDEDGRFIKIKFKNFTLINVYMPHGSRDKKNLKYKLEAYAYLLNYLKTVNKNNIILTGDFNIAHQEIDLARPKQNRNNIMFTPEERSRLDEITNLGFTDTFREFNKQGGNYTWWPYLKSTRDKNIGWRLDYIFISKLITPKLDTAFIRNEIFLSDHCPTGIEINL